MRRYDDARIAPERMLLRQRLLAEDVENRGRELAAVERGDQIGFDQMPAARAVDDGGAARQAGEEPLIEDALGRRRQRQQADEDLAARQQRAQAVRAVEAGDAGQLPLAAAPAGNVEAQHGELERGVAAELAQAQHADATLGGVGLRPLAPDALALLLEIEWVLAMEAQHLE